MKNSKKRKRSRSRSRDKDKKQKRFDEKLHTMQSQIDNLTTLMMQFIQGKEQEKPVEEDRPDPVISENNLAKNRGEADDIDSSRLTNKEKQDTSNLISKDDVNKEGDIEILKILGNDPAKSNKLSMKLQPELITSWSKLMQEGLPEKTRQSILDTYSRKGERQNSVGTAIQALGAAMTMAIDQMETEEGSEGETFIKYLAHAGQLSGVFFQQSVARTSFVTPILNKSIKPTLDATKSDEWLYGTKLVEQVKEAKSVERAAVGIKAPEKSKSTTQKSRDSGNVRYPPAKYKQVGTHPKKPTFKLTRRNQTTNSSRPYNKAKSQTSSRK